MNLIEYWENIHQNKKKELNEINEQICNFSGLGSMDCDDKRIELVYYTKELKSNLVLIEIFIQNLRE